MTYTIIFRLIAGQYSGVGPIPSPGRVLGALLAGAYRTRDERVVSAVRSLATKSQPRITTAYSAPYFAFEQEEVYSAGNLMMEGAATKMGEVRKVVLPGIKGGKVPNSRTTRLYPAGAFFAYTLGEDAPDRELIALACEKVAFLGTGADLVTVTVDNEPPAGRTFVPVPWAATVGIKMRTWSSSLLAHYDAQYEAAFVARTAVGVTPLHIDTAYWVETQRGQGDQDWFVIPLSRPVNPKAIVSLTKAIDAETVIPLPDLRGRIRGLAVPEDQAAGLSMDASDARISVHENPYLATHDMSYWTRPSPFRISATPLVGHPDPQVVVWQLEQLGFTVRYISSSPFHHSQGTKRQAARPARPLASWWLALEGDTEGLVQCGELTNQGFGLFRPVKREFFDELGI